MSDLDAQYANAVELATTAYDHFTAEPMVDSKRGGPRLSPWWKVYNEATMNVARLARLRHAAGLDQEPDTLEHSGGLLD
jgi:hypothetical protein